MTLAPRMMTEAWISSVKPRGHEAAEAMQTRCAEDSHSAGRVWLGRAAEHGTPEPDAGHRLTALI